MTAMRFPAGGNLWRTQSYYPWTEEQNGGMLESVKVGLREGGEERLSRGYAYNGFGDILARAFANARQMRSQKPSALTEGTTSNSFSFDGLGRLTSAYGRSYSYEFCHCRLQLPDTWQWPNSQPADRVQRAELRL